MCSQVLYPTKTARQPYFSKKELAVVNVIKMAIQFLDCHFLGEILARPGNSGMVRVVAADNNLERTFVAFVHDSINNRSDLTVEILVLGNDDRQDTISGIVGHVDIENAAVVILKRFQHLIQGHVPNLRGQIVEIRAVHTNPIAFRYW